jgi:hypothetical protein
MIAREIHSPSARAEAMACGIPASSFAIGSGTPMIPVDEAATGEIIATPPPRSRPAPRRQTPRRYALAVRW